MFAAGQCDLANYHVQGVPESIRMCSWSFIGRGTTFRPTK